MNAADFIKLCKDALTGLEIFIVSLLFAALGVDEETASEDACKIEHVISDTTFEAIKRHFEEHKILK